MIWKILVVIAVALGTSAGAFIGANEASAVRTTWGNLKCQYSPRCSNPPPVDDLGNKNDG